MPQAGWQVEDAFFGALLGAVLGVIAPKTPPMCFALLTLLLAGIVVLLNKAGGATGSRRVGLITAALLCTILGCAALCLIGAFAWTHGLWLAIPISAWVLVKLESEISPKGA